MITTITTIVIYSKSLIKVTIIYVQKKGLATDLLLLFLILRYFSQFIFKVNLFFLFFAQFGHKTFLIFFLSVKHIYFLTNFDENVD